MVIKKEILQEYTDASELVKETEHDINVLRRKQKTIVQTKVKGSNPDYPYQEQSFLIKGTTFTAEEDSMLRKEEYLLQKRKNNAEKIKLQVEMWMLNIPMRMQRIVRYKYLEGLSWEEVAFKIGRKATAESVRKEFERFFAEN